MTQEQAKEKAEELVNKYFDLVPDEKGYFDKQKQCALICINEMLNISDDSNEQRFLEQVKQEIEKL